MVKKEELPEFFKKYLEPNQSETRVYKSKGCSHCQAGYRGRTVIAEVLCFDEAIRDLVCQGKIDLLRHKNKEEGLLSLEQDAIRLVREGITSLEEAERVAG